MTRHGFVAFAFASLLPSLAAGQVLYRATGVIDRLGAATAIHCTNLGAHMAAVSLDYYNYTGVEACHLTENIDPGETRTFTTRNTGGFLSQDGVCPATAIQQGSVAIAASGSSDLHCSVQVLGALSGAPSFVASLPLYTADGVLLSELILDDGFESGNLDGWSASVP